MTQFEALQEVSLVSNVRPARSFSTNSITFLVLFEALSFEEVGIDVAA